MVYCRRFDLVVLKFSVSKPLRACCKHVKLLIGFAVLARVNPDAFPCSAFVRRSIGCQLRPAPLEKGFCLCPDDDGGIFVLMPYHNVIPIAQQTLLRSSFDVLIPTAQHLPKRSMTI